MSEKVAHWNGRSRESNWNCHSPTRGGVMRLTAIRMSDWVGLQSIGDLVPGGREFDSILLVRISQLYPLLSQLYPLLSQLYPIIIGDGNRTPATSTLHRSHRHTAGNLL